MTNLGWCGSKEEQGGSGNCVFANQMFFLHAPLNQPLKFPSTQKIVDKKPDMQRFTLLFILMGYLWNLTGQTTPARAHYEVYLYLLEDCKITQAYTDKLQEIYQTFANDSIRFTGFFPNPVSEDATMQAFVEKYQLPFVCTREGAYSSARRFGVTVTPEVVVYDSTHQEVVYQGRIDNLFERVGQRRRVVTSHDLVSALTCIQQNKPVKPSRTQAVGCFLQ